MELIVYPLLGTKSQRLMRKRWRRKKNGITQPYHYVPQYRLILRLIKETGLSEELVRQQIFEERLYLLGDAWGNTTITAADV